MNRLCVAYVHIYVRYMRVKASIRENKPFLAFLGVYEGPYGRLGGSWKTPVATIDFS